MKRTVLVPALAMIAVVAIAVPALAQPENVTPRLAKISKRALVKSGVALRVARQAKRQARAAFERPPVTQAHVVESSVAPSPAAPATQVVSGLAAGEASTSSETLAPLPGGPSLSVTVPPSGLIEVWVQVTMSDEGAVSLFEDGVEMPGQSDSCGDPDGERVLISSFTPGETVTIGTPSQMSFVGCGTDGPPGPVLFQTSPGPHAYELRYEVCGCAGEVTFSDRSLRIAPRP